MLDSAARSDPVAFYSLVLSSMLESSVDVYVANLSEMFSDDPAAFDWLRQTWLPEESSHGEELRSWVRGLWPEFDWDGCYAAFGEVYWPRCDVSVLRRNRTLECVARCLTETEASMMYRGLASYLGEEAQLQATLRRLARDEIRHFNYFRRLSRQYTKSEGVGFWTRLVTVIRRGRLVKQEDIRLPLDIVNGFWDARSPFQMLPSDRLLRRLSDVITAHCPLPAASRLVDSVLAPAGGLQRIGTGVGKLILARSWY